MTNTMNAPKTFSLGVPGVGVAHYTTRTNAEGRVFSHDIRTDNFTVHLVMRSLYHLTSREYYKTTRIYGVIEAFCDPTWHELEDALLSYALKREYSGELQGKCPVLAAHHRAGTATAKAGVLAAQAQITAVLRAVGLESVGLTDELELKYSMKAGCSMCPCSPGFIAGSRVMIGRPGGLFTAVDLHFS